MADHQPHTAFDQSADKVSMSRVAQWGGAVISIGLLVGMGVWVYQVVTRDVSGVPIVKAEGPLRVQPENPGGRPADNQGLSVNSVVSDGTASDAADRLVLAPEPQGLTEEDLAQGDLPELTVPAAHTLVDLTDSSSDEQLTEAAIDLAEQLIAEEQENGEVAEGDDAILLAVLEATSAPDAPSGPESSPFPKLRPVPETAAVAQTQTESVTSTSVREVSPDAVPDGSRLVQLGAFSSAEIARSEWDRMSKLFSGYLQDKTRVIQRAESGGKIFYRLRAMGFEDIDDARRFCAAFKARNVDCVPVLVR